VSNPRVSVIIPTYNRSHYLGKAIDSVLTQSYGDYELIVVDDGSTDDTQDALAMYRNAIKLIRQENGGASSARNTGIRAARGEWVAFLDSDDEWLPEKLYTQMRSVVEKDTTCLHTTNYSVFSAEKNGHVSRIMTGFSRLRSVPRLIEHPLNYQIKYGLARTPCVLVRKEALFRAGLFDERMTIYEDQDLMCRLALEGPWSISSVDLVRVNRYQEDNANLSRQRLGAAARSNAALLYLYEKLSRSEALERDERILVAETVSRARAGLGMALIATRQKAVARSVLREAKLNAPSLKARIRYLLTLFPTSWGSWLVSVWLRLT
jgi:glycosyltransferase involved in cell wall biosynthesis